MPSDVRGREHSGYTSGNCTHTLAAFLIVSLGTGTPTQTT